MRTKVQDAVSMNRQEDYWSGAAGDAYQMRNQVDWMARVPFWSYMLKLLEPKSVLDVGCGPGWNQLAIGFIDENLPTLGVDVNESALKQAVTAGAKVHYGRAIDLIPNSAHLVCTSGVLIHVPPEELVDTMQSIIDASQRYVLAIEYHSQAAEHVVYRGESELLWKRPYGQLYRELGLTLVDSWWKAEGFDRCHYWAFKK